MQALLIAPANDKPHAALMDRVYRRQRHFYDLTRKYYLLGRDRLVRELQPQPGDRIVEIGCGTARNLIRIARRYPDVRLYGLDASAEMLRTATDAVARAGLSQRIALKHGLAEDVTPAFFGIDRPFDHAIFSYSLSMIPDWRGALATAASSLREDGRVHVVDFGDQRTFWPIARRALRGWLALFHVAPRDELLGALETTNSNQEGYALHVLPGRYAFVLKIAPRSVAGLVRTVAQK
jgi:S-adenosylmethionine-diacylgycerolhomoserine-N-methlytransferase